MTPLAWARQLASGQPHQMIGGVDDPYMLRWYVIPRNRVLNMYVHKFLRSDDDRALHDHPWWFVSLMLRGEYDEVTAAGVRRRRAGSIAFRHAEWRHRVALVSGAGRELPCWTVIVTGRRARTWGFWCPLGIANRESRFVPWREFGDAGCGEVTS